MRHRGSTHGMTRPGRAANAAGSRPRPQGRALGFALGLIALLVLVPSLALAQSTEQRQSRPLIVAPEAIPYLDLAAMTLTIDDLTAAGLEDYGIGAGKARSLRQTAEAFADNRGDKSRPAIDEQAAFLEGTGWQRGYEGGLGTLNPDEPGFFASFVTSSVDVYTTSAGARQSFANYSDPAEVTVAEVTLLPDPTPLGDARAVWLVEGEATDTGEPYQAVIAMFQQGNIEGGVGIYRWDNETPDPAVAQELAATLLARIIAAPQPTTPPLSTTALAFGDTGIESYYNNYLFRDDVVIPFAGDTTALLDQRRVAYGAATGVYNVNQFFPAGEEGEADDARYALWRYTFADEAAAQAWYDDQTTPFGSQVAPLAIGDEAIAYSYTLAPDDAPATRGFVGYLRVGPEVAVIDLRAAPEVPLVSFTEVMQLQARCMDGVTACTLADIPWQLRNTLVPEPEPDVAPSAEDDAPADASPVPDATPEATPVS